MAQKQIDELLIDAQHSGKYMITIHYLNGKNLIHHFATKNFLINDIDICIEEFKKYNDRIKQQNKEN